MEGDTYYLNADAVSQSGKLYTAAGEKVKEVGRNENVVFVHRIGEEKNRFPVHKDKLIKVK